MTYSDGVRQSPQYIPPALAFSSLFVQARPAQGWVLQRSGSDPLRHRQGAKNKGNSKDTSYTTDWLGHMDIRFTEAKTGFH